jgi:hypothetical protein
VREFTSKPKNPKSAEDVNPLKGFKFKLDDEEFECKGRLSMLDVSDLARRVSNAPETPEEQEANPEAMAAVVASMSESLLMAMGQAEYERLRRHVRINETTDEVQVEIMQLINDRVQAATEEEAGRPTVPSSPSSNGPEERDERIQKVISFQTGEVTIIPAPKDHQQPRAQGTARPRQTPAGTRRVRGQRAAG